MDGTRLAKIEKKVAPRIDAIFWRILWEKDGTVFSRNPSQKGVRPMSDRELMELESELDADPATSLIIKHLPLR